MPRVKRGVLHAKRRKNTLKTAKGFQRGRKKLIKLANTAVIKAGANAFRDRKTKKRTARALWLIKLNAAVRQYDLSYSKFIDGLKKSQIELDRKVLSQLADKHPDIFKAIVEKVKKAK